MRPRLLTFACAFAAAATLAGVSAAAPTPPSFAIGGYPVGSDPNGLALGDVNGDTFPDLVSANAGADSVTVVSLAADGTVLSTNNYAVGDSPRSVAIGDLNGDAFPDLAVANFGDPDPSAHGSVSVLYGRSTGTFDPAIDVPLGSHPASVAIADLDGDTYGDVAVAMSTPDNGAILWGPGPNFDLVGCCFGSSVAIGDLDGAGPPDYASTDRINDSVLVGLGLVGRGGFGNSFATQTGGGARSVAIGDLNRDGSADLAVANEYTDTVSVLFGNGNGTFQPHVEYPVGDAPWSVAIGDLNDDGALDIATANPGSSDVTVLVNSGTGTFGPPSSFFVGGFPAALAMHDLNGDGRLDVGAAEVISDQIAILANETLNTPVGTNVVVTPLDPQTGTRPLRITFAEIVSAGITTVESAVTGPAPPAGFEVQGAYYELETDAQFTSAEVCFPYTSPPAPPAPSIMHWVNGAPEVEPTTLDTGTEVCAVVTAFSPFALVVRVGALDTDAPVISCASADGEWHGANASIACTASDGGSGLADPGDAAFTLSTSVPAGTEDANASTGSREVCDAAGNCATAGPIGGNKVDRKAPALSLPANKTVDATSPAGATVSYAASASDGADLSPAVSCTPASGSVFAVGTTTVACTATDHVGNAAAGSFTVTVRGAKEQLARLVNEVIAASALPAAVKAQLLARLQPLLAAFDPSNPVQRRAVCTGLSTFAAVLRLLSGHGIPPAQAAAWIADANRIRAVLGC